MDPALKAYLDKMSDEATTRADKMREEATARAKKQDGDTTTILQALATQTTRIDSHVTWKPELEARFAQLKLSVRRSKQHRPRPHDQPYPCHLRPLPWSRARSKGNQATTRHYTPGKPQR